MKCLYSVSTDLEIRRIKKPLALGGIYAVVNIVCGPDPMISENLNVNSCILGLKAAEHNISLIHLYLAV